MIHFVVALRSEALPLVRRFNLKQLPDGVVGRPAFAGPDLRLIVSGMGQSRTTLAVEGLSGLHRVSAAGAWLNLGIAGHRDLPVGEAVLAKRVVDEASGRSWRLHPPTGSPCRVGSVCTVETVEERFTTDAAYEMEAASLCGRLPEAVDSGLLQILKIVSDNRQTGTMQVSASFVEELIEKQLGVIDWLVSQLRASVGAADLGEESAAERSDSGSATMPTEECS